MNESSLLYAYRRADVDRRVETTTCAWDGGTIVVDYTVDRAGAIAAALLEHYRGREHRAARRARGLDDGNA